MIFTFLTAVQKSIEKSEVTLKQNKLCFKTFSFFIEIMLGHMS